MPSVIDGGVGVGVGLAVGVSVSVRVSEAVSPHLSALWPYLPSRRANAQRALAITYPTVVQLLGDDAFGVLSQRLLNQSPHGRADWGAWGEGFAACLAQQPEPTRNFFGGNSPPAVTTSGDVISAGT